MCEVVWGLELFEPHYSVLDSDQHHGERHSIQPSALSLDLNPDSLYNANVGVLWTHFLCAII